MDDTRFLQLAETGGENVSTQPEVALQVSITLRTVEQRLDDQECPAGTDDLENSGEVAHSPASVSGFIQNGE